MNILGVIPARYDSQRLPGKVLALIGKKPMVQWVYEAALNSKVFSQVAVATDSDKVASFIESIGGKVEWTSTNHTTGTDRVAEVASRYPNMKVVVNVQGDQPFLTSSMLQTLVAPYIAGETPEMTTLGCPLDIDKGYPDPNVVKVICGKNMQALYFSRSPIPFFRNQIDVPLFHHLGLYAFRQDFLNLYTSLKPTPIEQCEGLEQLRVLEYGYTIRMCKTDTPVLEVNTAEDLAQANKLMLARS